MSGRHPGTSPFSGPTRIADGLTVFASDADGRTIGITRADMPLRQALRDICNRLDALPGEWKIDCISSPSTIWRDLQGSREYVHNSARVTGGLTKARSESESLSLALPEHNLLGGIGRLDILRRAGRAHRGGGR